MTSGFASDPQSERGYPCQKNRLSITNYAELRRFEEPLAAKRGVELEYLGVRGKFDVAHLRSIHKHLFQDVFPWAGEFRVVNISKGNSNFGPAVYLAGALADALEKLRREDLLRGLDASSFAACAAFYLGEINAIHPFREGNVRAQREFIRQLALQAGHPLSWEGFRQEPMVDASILSHMKGNNSGLAAIVEAALLSTRQVER